MTQDFNGQGDNRFAGGQLVVPAAQSLPAQYDPYGPARGYGTATTDEPELFGVKIFDYWRIINKRKWLILGITLKLRRTKRGADVDADAALHGDGAPADRSQRGEGGRERKH